MQYTATYLSPLGEVLLAADDIGLTGLWFVGQKYFALYLDKEHEEKTLPVLVEAKRWLDLYFSGKEPDFTLPLHFTGTVFQNQVWDILSAIPYGKTVTYGEIAKELAKKLGPSHMSAQAVGGAVGRNEISIIVPCHRVVGTNGSLTGYAGGIDKKIALLKLEGAWKKEVFRAKKEYSSMKRVLQQDLIYEVLSVVGEIPPGKVATYGQIARLIGRDKNARLVGKILSMAEYYGEYPCHRVVNHAGRLVPGWQEQQFLLMSEGVVLKDENHVELKLYQWDYGKSADV